MDGGGQRFMNTVFAGGIQHAEIISVPDRMVGLSKYQHIGHMHRTNQGCLSLSNVSVSRHFLMSWSRLDTVTPTSRSRLCL